MAARYLVSALPQARQRGTCRVRKPARRRDQLIECRALVPLQQINDLRSLRPQSRGGLRSAFTKSLGAASRSSARAEVALAYALIDEGACSPVFAQRLGARLRRDRSVVRPQTDGGGISLSLLDMFDPSRCNEGRPIRPRH